MSKSARLADLVSLTPPVLTGAATLDSTYANKTVLLSSASTFSVNLPAASALGAGDRISFFNSNTGVVTINRAGSDVIQVNNNSVTSLSLGAGDTLVLVSNGSNWFAVGGSTQQAYAEDFISSFSSSSGYQKLPSGLIVQWGQYSAAGGGSFDVTFPTPFPTAIMQIVTGILYTGTGTPSVVMAAAGSPTLTGFKLGASAALTASYTAFGR